MNFIFCKLKKHDNILGQSEISSMLRIYAERSNVLDYAICEIRDCFDKVAGYPVLADTGEKTDLCFSRRFADVDVKAYLDPSAFLKTLENYVEKLDNTRKRLVKWFGSHDFVMVQTERLFHFEYGAQYRHESMLEWANILNHWDLLLDRKIIESLMSDSVPPYRQEKPHASTVYNMDFLRAQAEHHSLLKSFIRD